MKADGTDLQRLAPKFQSHVPPRWSPDGSRIAFNSWNGNKGRVHVVEIATGKVIELPDTDEQPEWSPDGKKIVCLSLRTGGHVVNADGTDGSELRGSLGRLASWSPDGSQLVFLAQTPGEDAWRVYTIGVDGKNKKQISEKDMKVNWLEAPRWSPDGKRIAFSALDGDSGQIAVARADGSDVKILTSKTRSYNVRWSPDGKLLGYISIDDRQKQVLWISDPDGEHAKAVCRDASTFEWKPK